MVAKSIFIEFVCMYTYMFIYGDLLLRLNN